MMDVAEIWRMNSKEKLFWALGEDEADKPCWVTSLPRTISCPGLIYRHDIRKYAHAKNK
jgi:hypothetical protein